MLLSGVRVRLLPRLTLNSLSGISLNVTIQAGGVPGIALALPSQFPFWDFVECNIHSAGVALPVQAALFSQFPFWDFVECN
jgi:hypothetical protein